MKIVLKLRYKGSSFAGWQVQKNAIGVQQIVQDAVEKIFGIRHSITGCSRTDSGVHANEYYCHLPKNASFSALERLHFALNTVLPDDISVCGIYLAEDNFHARYDAKGKEYIYLLHNSRVRNPFYDGLAYIYPYNIDIGRINKLGSSLIGQRDFSALCGLKEGDSEDNVRNLWYCNASRKGELVEIAVAGDGFLYNMVRIIIGTLLDAQSGKLNMSIAEILESRDRLNAGITAPAHGLYLNKVFFQEGLLKPVHIR